MRDLLKRLEIKEIVYNQYSNIYGLRIKAFYNVVGQKKDKEAY